jgi:hypothetical protein
LVTIRHPVVALAALLDCREGQAYSVLLGALFAAVLLALGVPPVLSHRPAAEAAPPAAPSSLAVTPTTVVSEPAGPPPTAPPAAVPPSPPLPLAGPLGPAPFALPPVAAPATAPAGPSMSGSGTVLDGREGTPLLAAVPASGVVALVSNARGVTATIDWGDGTQPSKGDVAATSTDSAQVSGSHTYTEDGTYRITVTVTDPGGAIVVVLSEARIADPPDALNQALDRAEDGH